MATRVLGKHTLSALVRQLVGADLALETREVSSIGYLIS